MAASAGFLGEALPGMSTGEVLGAHGATWSWGPGTSTLMSVACLSSFFLPISCGRQPGILCAATRRQLIDRLVERVTCGNHDGGCPTHGPGIYMVPVLAENDAMHPSMHYVTKKRQSTCSSSSRLRCATSSASYLSCNNQEYQVVR
jgi:hypothetical protein